MTTTTLTAPLTLLWVQVKVLRWVILAIVLVVSFDGALAHTGSMASIPFRCFSHIVLLFIASLTGPFLFGTEFLPGHEDYLRTRPVSARSVFTTKMTIVLLIAVICSQFWTYRESSTPSATIVLVLSFYICIGLWSSTLTILLRDFLRGFIASVVTISFAASFLTIQLDEKSLVHIEGFFSILPIAVEGETFTIHLLAYTIFLLFGIASLSHTVIAQARFKPTFLSIASFSAYTGFFAFCLAMNTNEGSVSFERISPASTNHIRQSRWEGDRLQTVEVEAQGRSKTLTLRKYFFNGTGFETESSITMPNRIEENIDDLLWEDNKLLVTLSPEPVLIVYDLGNPFAVRTFRFRWSSNTYQSLKIIDSQTIELRTHFVDSWETELLAIDYSKEALNPTGLHPNEIGLTFYEFHGRYLPYTILPANGTDVGTLYFKDKNLKVESTGPWHPFEARETVVAGIDNTEGRFLNLVNVDNPVDPIRSTVKIPLRFWLPFNRIFNITMPMMDFWTSVSFKFGEEYLALIHLELKTVAVWDIRSFQEPVFVGLAKLPAELALGLFINAHEDRLPLVNPTKRPDGALGYLTNTGEIVWLEFPALMKEAKKS